MKTIKVIAIEKRAVNSYVENLNIFFKDYANIEGICLKYDTIKKPIKADVFVVSNVVIYNDIKDLIPANSNIVYIDIAFYEKDIEKLTEIPKGTNVLLVDYKEHMAISLIALINEYGINHINLIPYAPDIDLKNIEDIDIAITPNLFEYVPKGIKKVIDIGYRKIDVSTITMIASILGISNDEFNRKVIEYSEKLCNKDKLIARYLRHLNTNKIHLEAILDSIDDGIIIHDNNSNILHCSKYFCKRFGKDANKLKYCPSDIYKMCKELLLLKEVENHFIKFDNKINVVVTKRILQEENFEKNYIVIIKDAENIQNIEFDIRKNLINKGFFAKYKFDDIVYCSNSMKKTIERAKKIASLDVTTLIYGDTGTGKELLAHSIHNYSKRKNYPFLAINCAAISENLLESELFGYEDGAFTGAKKGGKKGLFELAHNGTLFLDELSSIPQQMQVKLLRVLQEKEIMRIGGTTLIPVNVRIIASTNEDLEQLIEKGLFRKDLYFRINSFTITIPPLKERKEDIPLIINSIMAEHNVKKHINSDLMEFFMNYDWPGNVRELKNCIEYMIYMGDDYLTLDDLPPTIKINKSSYNKYQDYNNLLLKEEKEIINSILKICSFRNIGREKLHLILKEQGFNISEYKLRKILKFLKEKNKITYGKGRRGIIVIDKTY